MPRQFLCPVFGSSLWLALILQSLISSAVTYRRPVSGGKRQSFLERTLILLDVNTRSPVKVLNDNFLSFQLDPSIIKDGWLDFLSSKRLVTLARGLSPAYLRFGGKRTDFLQFHNLKNLAKFRGPGPDYYLKNYEDDIVRSDFALDKQKGCKLASHPDMMLELQREKAAQMQQVLLKEQLSNIYSDVTLTARSLDKLYNFADCAGLHLIFGLNALHRNPDNSWNTSSALSLLKYSAGKKYNISWELGNEPNSYRTMAARSVNSSRLAQDYSLLRTLLQSVRFYSRANLYGPNIGRPHKNAIMLLDGFMKNGGSVVDAVTWQHYYIDRRVTKVEDFLKTRLLDTLSEQITKVLKIVQTRAPEKRVWLGGVGPAWAGGTNNLSDTFAAGFLWLNTLGIAAAHGIDVVLRHSFFDYGYNHLVDQHFNPLPDYWLSLLFKRLVGPRVLAVHVAGLQRKPRPGQVIRDKLRIYAHCTSFHKSVQLNGEPLRMVDNETFPELKPRTLRAGRTIAMPPVSIGFYVIKNINAYACRR
ncbi:inactive heparanase-2-like isoform X2 [Carassius carassius]|uniref:inactive heparanase-2-like isoform X2 n=1 Tax=Carassius carassius TaxID=217509 RepID=UPI002869617F|nr:inactive heparanase-2-like isoform X2 [Carassius carassius]